MRIECIVRVIVLIFIIENMGEGVAFAQKEIHILTGEFAPYNFRGNGEIKGITTEIVKEVMLRMGYTPIIEMYPYNRGGKMILAGKAEACFSLIPTKERLEIMYYPTPISTVEFVFFKRKEDSISWQTMTDIRNYKVGIIEGHTYPDVFVKAVKDKEVEVDSIIHGESSDLQQLRKLKSGRTDLALTDISHGTYLIKKYAPEFDNIDFIDNRVGPLLSFHVGIVKDRVNSKKLFKLFNTELMNFFMDGKHKEIYSKYGVNTFINIKSENREVTEQCTNWEIEDNTFGNPFIHYTVSCSDGVTHRIDFNMYTLEYTTSDGNTFSYFNNAADHACSKE